jgi:hypothetical protein
VNKTNGQTDNPQPTPEHQHVFVGLKETLDILPNKFWRISTIVFSIVSITILGVVLFQNFTLIIQVLFGDVKFSQVTFDLDYLGFASGFATFGIGLFITTYLETKQKIDDDRISDATEKISEATHRIEFAARELLANQRQTYHSFSEVLDQAERIIDTASEVKVMTFTTTLGSIYAKDINELNLIYNLKHRPAGNKVIDLSLPEHASARQALETDIESRIGKLRELIMSKKKVSLTTYCNCRKGVNIIEHDFLSKIRLSPTPLQDPDSTIDDVIRKHLNHSKDAEKKKIEHIRMEGKIPLQMFIGKSGGNGPHYHECLVVFENLGNANHILSFSSTNADIVGFFESLYDSTPHRHGECNHKGPYRKITLKKARKNRAV